MLLYAVAFGVLLHAAFWGAGLSMLAMPRPWRRFWPALALPCGFTLQSLVVWLGAYANFRGTDRYAWPCELIPLILLILGCRRAPFSALRRWPGVAAVSAATLAALLCPLARAAKGLTTASLGSCDAADYAAGARVLQQFAHGDRGGFLGLTEVVHIMSVDNFFDFWLRLNHFTPSALIAFNGTIFHCRPHELTGLFPMVILAGAIPLVFWIARSLFALRTAPSLFLAALYGFSPLSWYAVDQTAIGQLLAAIAIALMTWAAIALWRAPARRAASFFPVLMIAFALLWGAYNFMIVACLAPAVCWVFLRAAIDRRWMRLPRWLLWTLLPLAAAGLLFWARVAGLLERFRLFDTYPFGWRIPAFGPEGWLGLVHGPSLLPYAPGARAALAAAALALLAFAIARGLRRGWKPALLPIAFGLPILAGYFWLLAQASAAGAAQGQAAKTYDAFKFFSVFYPLFLPGAAYWLTLGRNAAPGLRAAAVLAAAAVAAGVLAADTGFVRAMSAPPLIVDRDLIGLQRIESDPRVRSLNMRIPRMWERLWANAFLLRLPQYFETHTYEGRLNTPLRGEWDLTGGDILGVDLPGGDSLAPDGHYTLQRVASPAYCRAALGPGWYDLERLPRTSLVWRWSGADARIEVDNPQPGPLRARFRFDVSSGRPRRLEIWSGGREAADLAVGRERAPVASPPFEVPPGRTEWSLRSDLPPSRPSASDTRELAFSVYALRLDVLPPAR